MASSAMPDLGHLPHRMTSYRNRMTNEVFRKESFEFDQWTNMVRYVKAHADEFEMTMGEEVLPPVAVENGGEVTAENLQSKNWKQLASMATKAGIDPTDKTKIQLIDLLKG